MLRISEQHVLILTVISLLLCSCGETPYTYYPSLSDAEKGGAIKRGWIPTILPPSTVQIHEQHNIDSNNTWIRFNAPTSELKILLGQLRKLTPTEINNLFPFRHPGKWWKPTEESKNMYTIAAWHYSIRYGDGSVKNKIGYFFFDLKQGIGYYYYPGSQTGIM